MELTNFEDRSKLGLNTSAGFQFEFYCACCNHRWKSPFQPYRRGQFTGLLTKFAYMFAGTGRYVRMFGAVADTGEKGARDAALKAALALAESRYSECPGCGKTVCDDCWNERAGSCVQCIGQARKHPHDDGEQFQARATSRQSDVSEAAASAGPLCSNCQTALGGGRFCAECGFDVASTHKSCPGCGAMCTRSTRFCAECGHGF